jgi:hypothetical protein
MILVHPPKVHEKVACSIMEIYGISIGSIYEKRRRFTRLRLLYRFLADISFISSPWEWDKFFWRRPHCVLHPSVLE